MKNTPKGFAFLPIILIVAAVLAVGGGTYYYSENKDASQEGEVKTETNADVQTNATVKNDTTSPVQNNNSVVSNTSGTVAGWKTYTNSEHGFEFSYPERFQEQKEIVSLSALPVSMSMSGEGQLKQWSKRWTTPTDEISAMIISHGGLSFDLAASSITNKWGVAIPVTHLKIGSLNAIRYVENGEGWDSINFRVKVDGGKVIALSFLSRNSLHTNGTLVDDETTLNKIISSLKFSTALTQAAQATIDSTSKTSITGTAKNVTSLSVSIIAPSPTPIGYKSLYGRVVTVADGKWSLQIPQGAFDGFHGPYKIEVSVDSVGERNVLVTKSFSPAEKKYTNQKYGFELSYDAELGEIHASCGGEDCRGDDSLLVVVPNPDRSEKYRGLFYLYSWDPKNSPAEFGLTQDLKIFSENIWKSNQDKSALKEIVVGGHAGYTFNVNSSFNAPWTGEKLETQYTIVITEKNSFKYIMKFPSSEWESKRIADSFTFIR